MAVSSRVQADLLEASAVVPRDATGRIDEPRDVRRLRLRLDGADLSAAGPAGRGQTRRRRRPRDSRSADAARRSRADPDAARYLAPEPLIESDAPEIVAEAELAVARRRPAPAHAPSG